MIEYRTDEKINVLTFKELITRTTLHRRLDDLVRLQNMLDHADFMYTAWDDSQVIGYIRGLTDYGDVTYIADLGIDKKYWHQGIGTKLLALVEQELGTDLNTVLVASQLAENYYEKVGFTKTTRGYLKVASDT